MGDVEQGKHWCNECRTFNAYVFYYHQLMDKWVRKLCSNCEYDVTIQLYEKG